MNVNGLIGKVRTNPMYMFFGIAVIAGLFNLIGITSYVTLDMSGLFNILGVLVAALIAGGVIELIEPGKDRFVRGMFKAGTVILLLYILQPIVIGPLLGMFGL